MEKEIVSSLSHPNIIKYEDYYEDSASHCKILFTEFFESIQLSKFILQSELNNTTNNKIVAQIYDALKYLHENNIIHQDFNAKNILINPKNLKIKIVDFGISKKEHKEEIIWSPQGNIKYRPPLFFQNYNNRYSTDIWSFCLVVLSILMKKLMTTKNTLKLIDKKKKKCLDLLSLYSDNHEEINGVLDFLETVLFAESKETENKHDSPLKLFELRCKS